MRGVLGRVSASAAGRILDSADPREIRTLKNAVSVAAKTREDTASMTSKHKFLSGNRGSLCVEEFRSDSTPPVREKTRGIRDLRPEKLQGIAEDASSAPRLTSSSAASFPGRNKCPGTHCSLIILEEREDSSCQICHRV